MNFHVTNSVAAKALRVAVLLLAMTCIYKPMEALAGGGNLFYNFSFLGNKGNVSGQFEVQPGSGSGSFPDLIVGINGTVSGFQLGNGSFNTLLTPNTFGNNDNYFSSITPYLTSNGVAFASNTVFFNLYSNGPDWILNPTYGLASTGTLAISQ